MHVLDMHHHASLRVLLIRTMHQRQIVTFGTVPRNSGAEAKNWVGIYVGAMKRNQNWYGLMKKDSYTELLNVKTLPSLRTFSMQSSLA